ncbi:MAG: hypothetical protein KAV87_06950 [Desulfobacteraceae bacterium]|nr:hypothetical protein [Desulfobacteraceae bacterium]
MSENAGTLNAERQQLNAERARFESEKREFAESAKKDEPKKTNPNDKWIFESAGHAEIGVCIKPTTQQSIPDGLGGVAYVRPVKAVYLAFKANGRAVIDESFAKQVGHPKEILAEWAIGQPQCGSHYFLVHSPDKSMSEEDLVATEKAMKPKVRGRKQRKGVRTIGGK